MNTPKQIFVQAPVMAALIMGMPDLFGKAQPMLVSAINNPLHTTSLSGAKIKGQFELMAKTESHPAMLVKAEIVFEDLSVSDKVKITQILDDTDFDIDLLSNVQLGEPNTFIMVDADGELLQQGGITINTVGCMSQDMADVMKTILGLEPTDGKTNLWPIFAKELDLLLAEAA